MYRRRTGFADVVTADGNWIPARHFLRGELNHVGEKAQRGFDRENGFVLCLDFFEDVRLNCAAQLRNNFWAESAFGRRDVHRHDDWRGTADSHRCRKIRRAEIKAIIEAHHVFDRIDGHAALPDFSEDPIRIAIDTIERRPIERRAEPVRALVPGKIMKALVRVLGEHQTREQSRWLFGLRQWLPRFRTLRRRHACRYSFTVFFEAFDLANWLQIHLAVRSI